MSIERKTFTTQLGDRDLVIEHSVLAGQANGAIIARYGNTSVLATAVMGGERNLPYFPLSVNYEERFYAAGKILGSRYVRREGRPSTEATLNGRLIDRTIRPLFDHRLRRDIQVVVTVLSVGDDDDPDFLGLIAASTALSISDIPWAGPVAGVRVSKKNGEMVISPRHSEREEAALNMFIAGTEDRINMLEAEAKEAQEEDVIAVTAAGHEQVKKIIAFQNDIVKEIGKEKKEVELKDASDELKKAIEDFVSDKLENAVYVKSKAEQKERMDTLMKELNAHLEEKGFEEDDMAYVYDTVDKLTDKLLHKKVLEEDARPDGRKLDEVRPLETEVQLIPRMHGSAVFMRGNTQVMSVTTLAAPGQEQLIETMETEEKKRFMHHYNFPPYSVGETGFFRGPGRREIGHGALAEKAIEPLLPPKTEFPYTIRVVSETLSSNGSSSMASVCATSLSLMDAGVPLKNPAAGIAMGLITAPSDKGEPEYKILTDIQGPEDHHGDMDLKVAGSKDGVTAIQMDVKIEGLTVNMLSAALVEAKKARLHILEATSKSLSEPRPELSPFAPRVFTLMIDPEKIGGVIGSGGKVINEIIEQTDTQIDIEQDGTIFITGESAEKATKAMDIIKSIVHEFEVGELVEGEIVKVMDFGAILQISPQRDGMIHISEIAPRRIAKVEDVLNVGDRVKARVIKVDKDTGRIGLSTKEFN